MSANVIARVLLTLGFIAASIGYSSWTAQRTILDPSATQGATHALLATPAVNTMLTRELHTALTPLLAAAAPKPAKHVGPKRAALNARAAKDAHMRLNAAIDAAVRDPRFIGAFEDAITSLHRSVLAGGAGQVTLDPRAVTTALNRAIARIDPKLAPRTKGLKAVSVPIGGADLPHIGDVRHEARVIRNCAVAIAVVLIGGALLLAHDRKTFRRVGRRTAFLALAPALVFLAVPRVLAASHNSAMSVSAAVLEAYGHRVLPSAAIFAVGGLSIWLMALALPKRRATEADAPPPPGDRGPQLPDPRLPSGEPVGRPETALLEA